MAVSEYLTPHSVGKWAISRTINGRSVDLIQDRHLGDSKDAGRVLLALGIEPSVANLDQFFPVRGSAGRCPTLDLLEMCNVFDQTNPHNQQTRRVAVGV